MATVRLLVTGATASTHEQWWSDQITAAGHTPVLVDRASTSTVTEDLWIAAHGTNGTAQGPILEASAKPGIISDRQLWQTHGLCSSVTARGGNNVTIVAPSSPLAAGLSGTVRIMGSTTGINRRTMIGTPASAQVIAEELAEPMIVDFAAGATILAGATLAGRRVCIGHMAELGSETLVEANGVALVTAAINELVPTDGIAPTLTVAEVHGTGAHVDIYDSAGYDPATDILTVTGTAADTGGSGLSTVEVRVDGGAWATATGTATWSHAVDVSAWAAGTHTIEARATDAAANVSTITTATVWHSPDGVYGWAASGHAPPLTVEGAP